VPDPSLTVWIDTDTQEVSFQFLPQMLTPGQYGVVISSLIIHIAREFCASNATVSEPSVIEEMQRGIAAGLMSRNDTMLPAKTH